ncbi:hypothetical protein ABHI18_004543 [Aspergillus niger]
MADLYTCFDCLREDVPREHPAETSHRISISQFNDNLSLLHQLRGGTSVDPDRVETTGGAPPWAAIWPSCGH